VYDVLAFVRVESSYRWTHVLAAAVYLGVTLWAYRSVLPAPATDLPYPTYIEGGVRELDHNDQRAMLALLIHNTEALTTRPWTLFDGGQCHPLRRSFTLGEHAFVEGLLGVVPYALTRDPIVTYNCVIILGIWIAALAMYALSWSATRSAPAAFVAGFLFAFFPMRVTDPTHPMVHGNQWTPLALLFAHKLFARPTWASAAGLVLFAGLQILDGAYQLIAFAILAGTYGVYLVARNLRRLPALAPKILAVVAATAAIVAFFFGPYVHTRRVWGSLSGHYSMLYLLDYFAFGGPAYLGTATLVLAAIGLLDRLRGPRRKTWGYDPRLVYLAGGLLILWTVVWGIPIPGTGIFVPSPYVMALRILPGLDAVRAVPAARLGITLAASFIAGYGVLAITERRRAIVGVVAAVAITAAAFAEVFHDPTAERSFRAPSSVEAYHARPPEPLLELYAKLPEGPVLDLPLRWHSWGVLLQMGHYNLLSAYHHQPIAACYNSFGSPLQPEVEALAARVPDPAALAAVYALGFRSIVVHEEYLGKSVASLLGRMAAPPSETASLQPLGDAAGHHAFAIVSRTPIDASLAALATSVETAAAIEVTTPGDIVPVTYRNGGSATFRLPEPIEPTDLVARWRAPTGALLAEYPLRVLLPLALAPGESAERRILMPVPDVTGECVLTLAPATAPDVVISRRTVSVRRGSGASPPTAARGG
jgi:hypothetical protein